MNEVNNVTQETNRRVGSPSALQPKPNSTDHLHGSGGSSSPSQSVSTAKTQTAQPANGTSAFAEVPTNTQSLAAQPPIVPLPASEVLVFLGVKPDIGRMTLDEKFACLKQCFSYGYGVRRVLCEVFEAIRTEFKP
jgi:hypothetical protein